MIDTLVETSDWAALNVPALADAADAAVATHLALPDAAEATLLATDDAHIASLNSDFRGKATATNVLSWPSAERATPGIRPPVPQPDRFGDLHLGDIALAYETCAREAMEQGKPLAAHLTHLIVHGLLHLLGYDHETDADATLMEQTEREILGKLGLPDPY